MNRIPELRKERGISMKQAAEQLGMPYTTYVNYEKGTRQPNSETLIDLANFYNTSIDYMLGKSDERIDEHTLDVVNDIDMGLLSQAGNIKDALRLQQERAGRLPMDAMPFNAQNVAPLLGTVRAGMPMYAEENIEDYIPIRQTDGAKYFWLNIRGDSMNAAGMDEGDQILVREQPEVENGQLAVVMVNGNEATVKYFRREGDLVILTPKSFNPVHQPQIYDLKRVPVRIAGLVVECRKVFR